MHTPLLAKQPLLYLPVSIIDIDSISMANISLPLGVCRNSTLPPVVSFQKDGILCSRDRAGNYGVFRSLSLVSLSLVSLTLNLSPSLFLTYACTNPNT